ncbi:DUF916 domain-containing protein [Prosthecochloris sp. SCSIO W1101]|uniref:hypothetical protein n=1 Tax=Prosthecochloris sp. SCSIO W1101 TaxID=2992242 RepID=UPI00223E3C9B|nr:hypothetical protein [Prosthecochloris sp. SCSIO W1101]UZJ42688.1 DUF916 domain-containing protein [Prosthecochloris sp. SCSIO W1101]
MIHRFTIFPLLHLFLFTLAFSHDLRAEDIPKGQVGLSPEIFEDIRIGTKPVNETIRFYNFKDKPVRVEVSVHNWTTDTSNRVKLLPPTTQSLDQWMTINPLNFTVPPKQNRPIRFSIRPRMQPEPGEHRAIVYFTEIPAENDTTAQQTIRTRFRVGVGVYAIADPAEKKAKLHSFRLDRDILLADIENTGDIHVRFGGRFAIWKEQDFPGSGNPDKVFPKNKDNEKPDGLAARGRLNRFPVLPDTRRTIATALPRMAENGNYIVAVQDTLAGVPRSHTFKLTQ